MCDNCIYVPLWPTVEGIDYNIHSNGTFLAECDMKWCVKVEIVDDENPEIATETAKILLDIPHPRINIQRSGIIQIVDNDGEILLCFNTLFM